MMTKPQWADAVSEWVSPEQWRYDCIEGEWHASNSLQSWAVSQQAGGKYCLRVEVTPLKVNGMDGATSEKVKTGSDIQMLFRLLRA